MSFLNKKMIYCVKNSYKSLNWFNFILNCFSYIEYGFIRIKEGSNLIGV
jgi:hypothetical protein